MLGPSLRMQKKLEYPPPPPGLPPKSSSQHTPPTKNILTHIECFITYMGYAILDSQTCSKVCNFHSTYNEIHNHIIHIYL